MPLPRCCLADSTPLRRSRPGLQSALLTIGTTLILTTQVSAQSASERQANAGPLDTPLPAAIVDKSSGNPAARPSARPGQAPGRAPDNVQPEQSDGRGAASLKPAVRREQDTLEQLPRRALTTRAQQSERAAQIALGVSFAQEAALLGFSVAAANDAASDAARWYHRAASQGFPGAPSLDLAGVRHYPIRAARTPIE